ncbi:hypothetical protein ACFXG4_30380 [Nocardia sp. NPDC059246]|uniref:hypothetical protein n=1 Tax=unclassified Nocardia TaxID=2637762 RepID=UPI00369DB32E
MTPTFSLAPQPATQLPARGGSLLHLVPAAATTPPILVVGGCGGAGTTTTALGLAAAAVAARQRSVVVDATPAGGDLGLRGADQRLTPAPLQSWLTAAVGGTLASVESTLSWTSAGAGLLWRDEGPLQRRTTYATAQHVLTRAGYSTVFDGGYPVSARQIRPLLHDNGIRIVMTIPARVDAANRMRSSLQWLDDNFGPELLAATTVVVSHQGADAPSVAAALRRHLRDWIRDVAEIPFDRHLAHGLVITHANLSRWTQGAYARLLEGIWA